MNRIKLYEAFSKSDIDDFCKYYLVDLIDDEWRVEVKTIGMEFNLRIFRDGEINPNLCRKWSQLKDTIIPFIQIFITKYFIRRGFIFSNSLSGKIEYNHYSEDDVINDSIDDELPISFIEFNFNELKYKSLFENYTEFSKTDDFCKDHLVDLVDSNWDVEVVIHNTASGRLSGAYYSIIITDDLANPPVAYELRKWSMIKDSIIQFLQILSTRYNITGKICITGKRNNLYSYDEIVNDEVTDLGTYSVSLRFEEKDSIRESINLKELEYICKDYLIDLDDMGCSVRVSDTRSGTYNFSIYKQESFRFGDVKDSLLPFLELMSRDWEISDLIINTKRVCSNLVKSLIIGELEGVDDNTLIMRLGLEFKEKIK